MKCSSCGSDSEDGAYMSALVLTELGRSILAEFGTATRPGDRFDPKLHVVLSNISPERLLCLGYLCFPENASESTDWLCRKCLETPCRKTVGATPCKPGKPREKGF